jgi:hypothetical protein
VANTAFAVGPASAERPPIGTRRFPSGPADGQRCPSAPDAEPFYSYEGTREINQLIVGRTVTGRADS